MTGPLNLRRHPKAQPVTDPAHDPRLDEGIELYNKGHHWHAHEAWEPLWMGLEGDDKLLVQGLIMSAAMLVQYGKRVPRGVANHWDNVRSRIPAGLARKWGIDLAGLLAQLQPFAATAADASWGLRPEDVRIHRDANA